MPRTPDSGDGASQDQQLVSARSQLPPASKATLSFPRALSWKAVFVPLTAKNIYFAALIWSALRRDFGDQCAPY